MEPNHHHVKRHAPNSEPEDEVEGCCDPFDTTMHHPHDCEGEPDLFSPQVGTGRGSLKTQYYCVRITSSIPGLKHRRGCATKCNPERMNNETHTFECCQEDGCNGAQILTIGTAMILPFILIT